MDVMSYQGFDQCIFHIFSGMCFWPNLGNSHKLHLHRMHNPLRSDPDKVVKLSRLQSQETEYIYKYMYMKLVMTLMFQ